MKNLQVKIPYILLAIALVYIFFMQQCSSPDYKIKIVNKTTVKEVPVYKHLPAPKPIKIISPPQIVLRDVDSAAIKAECFPTWKLFNTVNVFERHILDDSIGDFTLIDSVHQNKILGSSLRGHYKVITHTQTTTQTLPSKERNKLYVGAQIGYAWQTMKMSVIPTVTLATKNDKYAYSVGINPFQKEILIGGARKIDLRRK